VVKVLTADQARDGGEAMGAAFPPDWLGRSARDHDHPVDDLDLMVLLLNSHDLLADPADRLTDLTWLRTALEQAGHPDLAGALRPSDLPRLRRLRADLRAVVETADLDDAAVRLNHLLVAGRAVPLLVSGDDGPRLAVGADRRGYPALAARLPAALAAHVAEHGLHRLGVCQSDPCRCVFVDRTRAATRRYCCGWCNDRRSARAYRRRRTVSG
jgi:predicted RNA-binding Zn ribbon-like protein